MKLAAYIRVSTTGQADDGYGLEVQRGAIERWAKANGHKVIRWCSDAGVSGAVDAVDRDGLSCVIDAVESGEAQGAIIARLDRLARTLHVQEAALAHLWRAGGTVFTVESGEVLQDDPDDPMRKAMRQMVGVFSELERSMIVKRLKDGRRTKSEQGGFAYGSPSFGYRAEGRVLVADEAEQAALRRIQELRAEGKSFRAIAATLTEEGIQSKQGKRWHVETLRRIVARMDAA
jgi:DNA invertase Pin-like site-specific DNA recombinase